MFLKPIIIPALLILPILILPYSSRASAKIPKHGRVSCTCDLNNQPNSGETQILKDQKLVAIGKAFGDGTGNNGIAIFDKENAEAEEAEIEAKLIAKGLKPGDYKILSALCLSS